MSRFATATAATTLGFLALKYNDRALFQERREGVPFVKGDPLVGGLFRNIIYKNTAYDNHVNRFEYLDTLTL